MCPADPSKLAEPVHELQRPLLKNQYINFILGCFYSLPPPAELYFSYRKTTLFKVTQNLHKSACVRKNRRKKERTQVKEICETPSQLNIPKPKPFKQAQQCYHSHQHLKSFTCVGFFWFRKCLPLANKNRLNSILEQKLSESWTNVFLEALNKFKSSRERKKCMPSTLRAKKPWCFYVWEFADTFQDYYILES